MFQVYCRKKKFNDSFFLVIEYQLLVTLRAFSVLTRKASRPNFFFFSFEFSALVVSFIFHGFLLFFIIFSFLCIHKRLFLPSTNYCFFLIFSLYSPFTFAFFPFFFLSLFKSRYLPMLTSSPK